VYSETFKVFHLKGVLYVNKTDSLNVFQIVETMVAKSKQTFQPKK